MREKREARAALESALLMAVLISHDNKPGAVIARMPKEQRSALEHLTSEDTRNVRVWWA